MRIFESLVRSKSVSFGILFSCSLTVTHLSFCITTLPLSMVFR